MSIENLFTGQGVVFPFTLESGGVRLTSGMDLIKSSIRVILYTTINSRYFLENFGSKLVDILEEPNNIVLEALIRRYVIDAITDWEKRIEPLEVKLTRSSNNISIININLVYRVRNTQVEETMVFPFYSNLHY